MTYVAYKNAFFREMQFWSHCYTVVSYQALYQYTKFQPYTFRVQKMCAFARYTALVPRLSYNKTVIDFNFGSHKDLSTLINDIHLGLAASVNYHFFR